MATGLGSRHRVEFGTFEHCRFAGLRPAAREILGAPGKLAKRGLEGLHRARYYEALTQHSGAACELLSRQLTSFCPAAHELLSGSSRATIRQLTSYCPAAHELLSGSSRANIRQLTSHHPAAYELLSGSSQASVRQLTSYYPAAHEPLSGSSRATIRQLTSQYPAAHEPPSGSSRATIRQLASSLPNELPSNCQPPSLAVPEPAGSPPKPREPSALPRTASEATHSQFASFLEPLRLRAVRPPAQNSSLCLETSLVANTEWSAGTPSPERAHMPSGAEAV